MFVDDFLIDTQIPFSIYTCTIFEYFTRDYVRNIHLVKIPSVQQFLGFQIQSFGVFFLSTKNTHQIKIDKSYDDSVKLKRTEMDPFRLG